MTSELYVSVIRAWRFVDAGNQTAVTHDLIEHRKRIGTLHGQRQRRAFVLPWPPFRSNYWRDQFNRRDYESTPPPQIVGSLVPLRALLKARYSYPLRRRQPLAEVYLEPFGLWTAITVDLTGGSWASETEVATDMSEAMTTSIEIDAETTPALRDGIDIAAASRRLSEVPWASAAQVVDAGTITLVSGVCETGVDPKQEANKLRSQFLGGANATIKALTRSAGASATSSSQVGLALVDGPRAASRIKCLHHNHTLLLGHLSAFSAFVGADAPAEAYGYRDLAARLLNHLYRGEPLPQRGIYKSRVAPAWIDKRGLNAAINSVTNQSPSGLLPEI